MLKVSNSFFFFVPLMTVTDNISVYLIFAAISVIYRGMRGTGSPTFWTEGYSIPTFQGEKVKNLL